MENKQYPASYALPVDEPVDAIGSRTGYMYKNKETGEWHAGWFHCGCCGRDGFASINTPTCTGCANKLQHGRNDDSPMSIEYIKAYCDYWEAKR